MGDPTQGIFTGLSEAEDFAGLALFDECEVIERILRHLGLREEGVQLKPACAPPAGEGTVEFFTAAPFSRLSRARVVTRRWTRGAAPICLRSLRS